MSKGGYLITYPKQNGPKYVNELYDILRATTERQCADMTKKMEKNSGMRTSHDISRNRLNQSLVTSVPGSIADSCKIDPKNGYYNKPVRGV